MYILILLLSSLVPIGGPMIVVPLPDKDTIMTQTECTQLRDQILRDMNEAYPNQKDRDYALECVKIKEQTI